MSNNRFEIPARERSRLELFQDSALARLAYNNLHTLQRLGVRTWDHRTGECLTRVHLGSLMEVDDRDKA